MFMVVVHRGREQVMADPDGTELATFRPNAQLFGRRLRVQVALSDHGVGSLREARRAPKGRGTYDVSFGTGTPAARIITRLVRGDVDEIEARPRRRGVTSQRCASLALATCLRQMLVTGPIVSGSGYGG